MQVQIRFLGYYGRWRPAKWRNCCNERGQTSPEKLGHLWTSFLEQRKSISTIFRWHIFCSKNCCQVDPATRPTAQEIVEELIPIHQLQLNLENKTAQSPHHRGTGTGSSGKIQLRKVGHKRSLSEEEIVVRKSPSEKARFHYLAYSTR